MSSKKTEKASRATKFKILRNHAPEYTPAKMRCDVCISKKNDEWEMARDHFNRFNTTAIIGRQGSGKTSLMVHLVERLYKKKVHRIYVFMPETSMASLKNNIFEDLPADQIYHELDAENLWKVEEKVQKDAAKGWHSLIIYDDVQSALKDKTTLITLKRFIANQRHLHLVNLILMQNFYSMDKGLRELINNLIFFKLDKSQTRKIFDNVMEMTQSKFLALNRFIFDKPREWCCVNLPSGRIYKKWDEVDLGDDDEN